MSAACAAVVASCASSNSANDEAPAPSADTFQAYEYYSDLGVEFDGTGCAEIGLDTTELNDEAAVNAASAQIRRVAAIGFTELAQYQQSLFALVSLHGVTLTRIGEPCREGGAPGTQFSFRLTAPNAFLETLVATSALSAVRIDATSVRVEYGIAEREELLRVRDTASDPSGRGQTIELTISPRASSLDAYPAYGDFLSDGKLDVGLLMGDGEPDTQVGLEVAHALEGEGFRWVMPTAMPTLENVPQELLLRQTTRAQGRSIEINVRILFARFFPDSDALRTAIAAFFRDNDIAVYDGHGAIVRGLLINNNMPIAAADFATFGLSRSRKQLFAFLGCRTYSVFGEGLFEVAAKDRDALDVLVTTNLNPWESPSSERLITTLVDTYEGHLHPTSYYALIRWMNSHPAAQREQTIYGVTGIDDNGGVHPFGAVANVGRACGRGCGDASGNECISNTCAYRVLRAEACPTTTHMTARGLWCAAH